MKAKQNSPLPGQRRKPNYKLYLTILIFLLCGGYTVGLCLQNYGPRGLTAMILRCLQQPFMWTPYTKLGIIGGTVAGGLMVLYLSTYTLYNRLPGQEHGQAKFISSKEANKLLQDPDNSQNRILSKNLRVSVDGFRTQLNGNTLVIGGSGSGKSRFYVRPNIMQMNASYVITDPKSELYRDLSGYLARHGYKIRTLNLINMSRSDHYNPIVYLKKPTDVLQLITNLIANTTPSDAHSNDPFWEKAEFLYLSSLFFYVWLAPQMEGRRTIGSVMQLMREAKIPENENEQSELDKRMAELEASEWNEENPVTHALSVRPGIDHPAVKAYNAFRVGAIDTTRSIIISSNARLSAWANAPDLLDLLSYDEMDIVSLGMGNHGHLQKTALFCIIPDSDATFNSVAGIFYTQIFQVLYDQADHHTKDGRLPIPVHFYLDEFANIALPKNFLNALSTMRSRNIACPGIMIQDLARIKKMFNDGAWEALPSNCDTLVYLGSNEQSAHKYISELLGKWTIDKRSYSEGKGASGSASTSDDIMGRELMTPDEVRMMDKKQELVLIRGIFPILDDKYDIADDSRFNEAKRIPAYEKATGTDSPEPQTFGALSDTEIAYAKYIGAAPIELSWEELYALPENIFLPSDDSDYDMKAILKQLQTQLQKEYRQEDEWKKEIAQATSPADLLKNRLLSAEFNSAQVLQAELGLQHGLSDQDVLEYFRPDYSARRMQALRNMLEWIQEERGKSYGKNEQR